MNALSFGTDCTGSRIYVSANSPQSSAGWGGREVLAQSEAFLFMHPPSALWITVIVSFVVLSGMTDHNQTRRMRSTHCRSNAFDPHFFFGSHTHTHTHTLGVTGAYLASLRVWQLACSTGHRRCDPTGQVTRRLRASRCSHTIEFLALSLMFETEEQQFPLRSRAHHPEPIENQSGGSPLFGIHLLQTGKYAKIWFAENPAIVLISVSFVFFLSFCLSCSRNTRGFIQSHICSISMALLSKGLFIFRTRPLVNLQCNQLVTVIYVMFSVTPDFYLNDNSATQ